MSPGWGRSSAWSRAAALCTVLGFGTAALATAAGAAPERAAACPAAHLSVSAHGYGVAGGQFDQTFTFTNRSDATCRLTGWPAVAVLDAAGQPRSVRTERVRQDTPPQPASSIVTLKPHGTASFDVYGADWDALHNRACPYTSAVAVTPPGSVAHLTVRVHFPVCTTSKLLVSPLIAGSSDRQAWSTVVG